MSERLPLLSSPGGSKRNTCCAHARPSRVGVGVGISERVHCPLHPALRLLRSAGAEGRAGMAAIVSGGAGAGVDLELLARELALRLPQYARPLFVRLVDAIDDTGR